MQREHLEARELRLDVADLSRSGQEAEDVSPGTRDRLSHGRLRGQAGRVSHLDGMRTHVDLAHGTAPEEVRNGPRVERRRHHEHPQVRAGGEGGLQEGEREVRVEAPLVELVEDHGGEVFQQGIPLEPPREDALGGHDEPRLLGELALEAHLEPHLAAERLALLRRDAGRDRPRGHAPGLEQENGAVGHERRGHPRRLPRSRRRHEHEPPMALQLLAQGGEVLVDRQRGKHGKCYQLGRLVTSWR